MVANIRFFDESTSGERVPAGVVAFAGERITARQLIRRRVEAEVAREHEGLVRRAEGRTGAADVEAQVQIALRAFERNGFFMLVADRQVETLDEWIDLEEAAEVCFLRLVPLVGG